MKRSFFWVLVTISLFNCSDHDHDHEDHSEEHENNLQIVEISKLQMEIAGIELGTFERKKLKNNIKANGILELPPQNRASISPMMGGTVKDIKVIEGDFVDEGQTLVLLQHTSFIQLQQDYLEALNRMDYLDVEYQRKKDLYRENISSARQFQQVEMEYKSNVSRVKSLQAKLNLLNLDLKRITSGDIQSFIEIKAPIHGYVRNIETSIGSYIGPNEKIIEIIDNHHIHIDLLVYENDIARVETGQFVHFRVASLADREHQAKVFAVGKAFEKDLKAVRVHAEIENADHTLLPGMYVDARIITSDEEVVALPESALHREGENNFIFLQVVSGHAEESDNLIAFKKTPVKVGVIDNGYAQVIPFETLAENTRVAVRGNYYLDGELNKGEGGHHH